MESKADLVAQLKWNKDRRLDLQKRLDIYSSNIDAIRSNLVSLARTFKERKKTLDYLNSKKVKIVLLSEYGFLQNSCITIEQQINQQNSELKALQDSYNNILYDISGIEIDISSLQNVIKKYNKLLEFPSENKRRIR